MTSLGSLIPWIRVHRNEWFFVWETCGGWIPGSGASIGGHFRVSGSDPGFAGLAI